jgi:hypothetical protein
MTKIDIYDLIDAKVVGYGEIVVCLFEHCNLKCVFCPQDHSNVLGASREEIMAKVDPIVNWINSNTKRQAYKLHIMGGELFQDQWIDEGFLDIYEDFIKAIDDQTDAAVHFNFITNLVFTRYTEVMYFLAANNLRFSISYDAAGRFSKADLKLFERNLRYFQDHIAMVSLVATKQNIDRIVSGDYLFDILYNSYTCDFDHFLPSVATSRLLMPSERDLFEFYKVLVEKYPKCLNVDHFVNNKPANKMICTRGNSFTIMPDGAKPQGCSGSVFLKEAQTEELGGPTIVENFLDKYNCFECEYFQRCPLSCFIKEDYKHIDQDMDECVFKATFRHADSIR